MVVNNTRKGLFVSNKYGSYGNFEINKDYIINFKMLGKLKFTPTLGDKNNIKFKHIIVDEYDPNIKSSTGNKLHIYFFDLHDNSPFNLGDATSKHFEMEYKTIRAERDALISNIEELLKIIGVDSVQEAQEQIAYKKTEFSKKMVQSFGSGLNNNNNNNNQNNK